MTEELFYLKDTRTGKYHAQSGLVSERSKATQFTQSQLKRRLNVAQTYTNVFKEKLLNAFLVMEPVKESVDEFLVIKNPLKIEYSKIDMLDCDVVYHYKNGSFINGRTVYSVYHDYLSRCENNKSGLIQIVLTLRGVVGVVNAD